MADAYTIPGGSFLLGTSERGHFLARSLEQHESVCAKKTAGGQACRWLYMLGTGVGAIYWVTISRPSAPPEMRPHARDSELIDAWTVRITFTSVRSCGLLVISLPAACAGIEGTLRGTADRLD